MWWQFVLTPAVTSWKASSGKSLMTGSSWLSCLSTTVVDISNGGNWVSLKYKEKVSSSVQLIIKKILKIHQVFCKIGDHNVIGQFNQNYTKTWSPDRATRFRSMRRCCLVRWCFCAITISCWFYHKSDVSIKCFSMYHALNILLSTFAPCVISPLRSV